MLLAEVAQLLVDVGTIAGILVAIGGALGLLSRARLVRWLWRQLIGDPVTRWQTRVVAAQVAPVAAEMANLAEQLVSHMGDEVKLREQDLADRARRQVEMDAWRTQVRGDIAGIREDVSDVKTGLGTVHRRIDSALQRLAEGNPEVRP